MQRYYILVSFAVLLNLSAAKADHLRDSVGVENLNGKKLIIHKIVAKDTYYSIGRKYNVSPKIIMAYNDSKFLSLDVLIKVPTERPFSGEATPPYTKPSEMKKSAEAVKKPSEDSRPATTTVGSSAAATQGDPELIDHAIQKKENLNMLAEKYGTTVNELKRINNLKSINLRIGQIIKIPVKAGGALDQTTADTATPATPVNQLKPAAGYKGSAAGNQPAADPVQETPSRDQLVVHTVAGNETMYSIASKYNLTLDQLKAKNNLSSNSLYVGQKLLISGQYPAKPAQAAINDSASDSETDSSAVKNPSLKLAPSRYGLSQMDEKGMAVVIADPDLDSSKMLVLHRTAPIGTIIKISNPMSNRSTYAKVVGKFTENESTKDVIIVMTKAVGDALGSLDKRFLCNLTYSGQTNEQ
ncbi:LysM peptidoglycan-binding domain-containing protein [Pedobacter sp. L105]|uniref:LysM peptidoglycan-binding domain-containing protein n=1 Tax=Pedobacter sp. L105 TaxID=1641871 RepID=UPI00131E9C21|nr:LysM peptidoglycan-binding domain-containing protein [Pedobacter sp. L105]